MNNITLIGRLTKDPEVRFIQGSGTPVASFTLAVSRDYKNKDGSVTTDFIPVEIMGNPANYVANYISKGNLIAVNGAIRVDKYDAQDGTKRSWTKVQARRVKGLEKRTEGENNQGGANNNQQQTNQYQASTIGDNDVPF